MSVQRIYKEFPDGSFIEYHLGKMIGGGVVVDNIKYHEPQGEGDAHYCDVIFSDNTEQRVFRPDVIDLSKPKNTNQK